MSSSDAAKHQQQQQTVETLSSITIQDNSVRIEKEEEAKLKAKYPSVQRPGPLFLQRRLQKGAKYFDSGDYNMAKAAMKKKTESDKASS